MKQTPDHRLHNKQFGSGDLVNYDSILDDIDFNQHKKTPTQNIKRYNLGKNNKPDELELFDTNVDYTPPKPSYRYDVKEQSRSLSPHNISSKHKPQVFTFQASDTMHPIANTQVHHHNQVKVIKYSTQQQPNSSFSFSPKNGSAAKQFFQNQNAEQKDTTKIYHQYQIKSNIASNNNLYPNKSPKYTSNNSNKFNPNLEQQAFLTSNNHNNNFQEDKGFNALKASYGNWKGWIKEQNQISNQLTKGNEINGYNISFGWQGQSNFLTDQSKPTHDTNLLFCGDKSLLRFIVEGMLEDLLRPSVNIQEMQTEIWQILYNNQVFTGDNILMSSKIFTENKYLFFKHLTSILPQLNYKDINNVLEIMTRYANENNITNKISIIYAASNEFDSGVMETLLTKDKINTRSSLSALNKEENNNQQPVELTGSSSMSTTDEIYEHTN